MAKILVTAKQRGSVNAVKGVVPILKSRGHDVDVYATGNDNEVAGFEGIDYKRIENVDFESANAILGRYHLLVSGLTGYETADGTFIRTANDMGIKSVGVNDQDGNYIDRFGLTDSGIPSVISLMNEGCLETIAKELPEEMAKIAGERARVIGWTAYDDFAKMREEFSKEDREKVLGNIGFWEDREVSGIWEDDRVYFHATQNVPGTGHFGYEIRVAEEILRTANDLGLKLVVKPHPSEEDGRFSMILAERYGHLYVPARSCKTNDLVLSSDSVTAGRSTMLNEACLLDRNTGGIFQPVSKGEIGSELGFYDEFWKGFPPISTGAIPYAVNPEEISNLFLKITSKEPSVLGELTENRKRFSVDGKASERLADLVEEVLDS